MNIDLFLSVLLFLGVMGLVAFGLFDVVLPEIAQGIPFLFEI